MAEPITSARELAQAVRLRRHDLGITQEELALASGTGRRFVIDLEAGKPTVRLASTLAVLGALGLEVRVDARGVGPR